MKKYLVILLVFIITIFTLFYLLKVAFATHVKINFTNLRPFHYSVPVYYNGIKVGKVLSRNHSKDFKYTILTVVVWPYNLKIPKDAVAYLKKHKLLGFMKTDYIDLVFPQAITNGYISNNSFIKGISTIDINDYGSNQNIDEIEQIKDNLAQSAENLNYAIQAITMLFETMNDIALQNKDNLHKTTTNVSNATNNFSNVTKKFDNSINQIKLNSSFDNLAKFTDDVSLSANSLSLNTDEVEQTIKNIQQTTHETKLISKGIRKTLSKPFGGFRFFFGRPIQPDTCP